MKTVDLATAQDKLADLVAAALKGEVVWIVKDEQSAVQLVPAQPAQPDCYFGSAKGLVTIAEDFDAPLADLTEYSS